MKFGNNAGGLQNMKRLVFALLFILCVPNIIIAQNNTTRFFIAYDYENITVDNTVGGKGFTASKINGSQAQSVTFTVDCASGTDCPIRITLNGTAPTTSVGMRVVYGQSVTIYSNSNIRNFRAIREGSTSAIINVTYFQ